VTPTKKNGKKELMAGKKDKVATGRVMKLMLNGKGAGTAKKASVDSADEEEEEEGGADGFLIKKEI